MIRYIPRKTKIRMELLPHVTLPDVIVGAFSLAIIILIVTSNLPFKWFIALAVLAFIAMLYFPLADGERAYYTTILLFRFFAFKKKYSREKLRGYEKVSQLIPYQKIIDEKFLDYGEYYGMVLQISPVEFFLLTEDKQDMYIRSFKNALGRLSVEQDCEIVKINKAVLYDDFIADDEKKYAALMEAASQGEITEKELQGREYIFQSRVTQYIAANESNRLYEDCYYIVVFDKDKNALLDTIEGMQSTLAGGQTPIRSKICTSKDLSIFLKANYTKEFNEREVESKSSSTLVEWTMPEKVQFRAAYTLIDGKPYRHFCITDYPLSVGNAWAYSLFSMPATKCVMKLKPMMRFDAEKEVDKAILEMETKTMYSARESKQIENQTHLQTLRQLLIDIKNSNENLYKCSFFITCEDYMKKEMRALLKQQGFKHSEMFGRQVDAFVSSNISRLNTVKNHVRGINGTPLSGMFPFISNTISDPGGFYLGYNANGRIFVNFFRRDEERVNSNMMVIGKSGGGKSFATKDILSNMAGDNSRIFVLDPESEYVNLAHNLGGKTIDVGSGLQGRINPFHITPSLQSDDESEVALDDYSAHLQFLEEFFHIILAGINSDAFEQVNSLVIQCYKNRGIDSNTDLYKLKPEDFPIFDDLYKLIIERMDKETDEYIKRIYQTMEIYIKKFATGGRNSILWNGPTTLETKENFVVFSFRSLLANNNKTLANAQMLLVLRFLNNEIIRNKDYNSMMGYGEADPSRRKIIVAVDEAHVFIDEEYPIALNFMEDLAKRIRKYDGMQIIITQNIKDFVGSATIQKQSTAIINASQFTMVLPLAPNDMTDLVSLYRNAGGINEDEQQAIVQASRGEVFFITSANSRVSLKIEALDAIRDMFQTKNFFEERNKIKED
jgi:hypothetical protein